MALKDLLVFVDTGASKAGSYGLSLAAACGASLTAAVPVVEPSLPPHLPAELSEDLLVRIREDAEASADKAIQEFSHAARQIGRSIEVARFKAIAGEVGYGLSRLARCFDTVILPQPDPDGVDSSDLIEACLFRAGRPLIVAPYIPIREEIGSVMIAWDGGVPAARAVADALPILTLARRVEVVTATKGENARLHLMEKNLVRHLTRHGIQAEATSLPVDEIDVADMLLSHAADSGVDLMVMGGYGHSRFREAVLGGTTREVLRSMTIPVLMSH